MALFKKKNIDNTPKLVEQQQDLKQLVVFITIVNHGLAGPITKIFQRLGSSAQFIQRGNGTASKEIRDILGIEDTGKDIILAIVKKDNVAEIKPELEAFFKASKYNRGVGFSISMTSIIGVKLYQFLADTL